MKMHRWVCAGRCFEKSRPFLLLEDKSDPLFDISEATYPVTKAHPRRPELIHYTAVRTLQYLKLDVETKDSVACSVSIIRAVARKGYTRKNCSNSNGNFGYVNGFRILTEAHDVLIL